MFHVVVFLQLLLKRSSNLEATDQEESEANAYTNAIPPFKPLENGPSVDMASSIMLVNRFVLHYN